MRRPHLHDEVLGGGVQRDACLSGQSDRPPPHCPGRDDVEAHVLIVEAAPLAAGGSIELLPGRGERRKRTTARRAVGNKL